MAKQKTESLEERNRRLINNEVAREMHRTVFEKVSDSVFMEAIRRKESIQQLWSRA